MTKDHFHSRPRIHASRYARFHLGTISRASYCTDELVTGGLDQAFSAHFGSHRAVLMAVMPAGGRLNRLAVLQSDAIAKALVCWRQQNVPLNSVARAKVVVA